MTIPILATKLYQPKARANLVIRAGLLEKLDEGSHRKLSVISAPAGFGKTTLVSSWLERLGHPVAWYSLDETDNELRRFFSYFVAALELVSAKIGQDFEGLLHSPQLSSELLLTALLNKLAELGTPFFFVLDDYHLIDNSEIDAALEFLLEHQAPNMHLVMTTREDPQLSLSRLRVRDQLTELRATDLKFANPEVAEFLNKAMGLNLSVSDMSILEARTEGWIAGLQLAALSMKGLSDTTGFIEAFAGDHHFVLDYLAEEVLLKLSERERLFLLQTSILERLSAPLCSAVTKQEDSDSMLETLERNNLFLIPLDSKRQWFRYHHLFADVLRADFFKKHTEQLPDLHIRASHWFEQNKFSHEAIHHALAAKDLNRAARLIELAWRSMDRTFQTALWHSWVKALPDELIRVRPVLSVGLGWVFISKGEWKAGEAWLHTAEAWLDRCEQDASDLEMVVADEEEFKALPVTIASARAYIAQALGDVPATIKHTSRALELLPKGDHLGRAIPLSILGLAYWTSGDLEAAYQSLSEGMAGFEETGNIMSAISGAFGLADIRIVQGRLHEAIRTYEKALRLVEKQHEPMLRGTAILYLGLSELYHEQGKLEAATEALLKSTERGKHDTQEVYHYRYLLAQARAKESEGDLNSALALLDESEPYYQQLHIPDIHPLAAIKAQLWIKHGRLNEAQTWLRERGLLADELSYLHEFEHMTMARLLIAQYKNKQDNHHIEQALTLLAHLLAAAEDGKRTGSVIDILILQSLAHHAQNELAGALEPLQKALTLAEPEGYVRTFIVEGTPMLQLLSELEHQGRKSEYVAKLLLAFEGEPDKRDDKASLSVASTPQALNETLAEPLTLRELEVLKLLAEGLSNLEISKRLFRALDTVKGYNRTLFGKLQVKDRHEAVAKARDLGLL